MSEIIETKSNSDLSSNSSWSVLDESGSSRDPSVINLLDNVCSQDRNNNITELDVSPDDNIDTTFINIPETDLNKENDEENNNTEENSNDSFQFVNTNIKLGKSKIHKTKSKKKQKKNNLGRETLSLFTIAASILTLTGITLLCMLLSDDNDGNFNATSRNDIRLKVEKTPPSPLIDFNISKFKNYHLNLLTDVNQVNKSQDYKYPSDDEICSIEENEIPHPFINNFDKIKPTVDEFLHEIENFEEESSFHIDTEDIRNATNKFFNGLKKAFANGSLHVLICAFMQDLCLIKLVRQINKFNSTTTKTEENQNKEKSVSVPVKNKSGYQTQKMFEKKIRRKLTKLIKNKLKQLEAIDDVAFNKSDKNNDNVLMSPTRISDSQILQKINKRYNNDTAVKYPENENGKTECQRRFEELDNEWDTLGQNHRQKLQEIKEKFKNEIHFIKENETEGTLRKQRIKIIREKYQQRLKNDREKYLLQLGRLRDERHRILNDICHKKKLILDYKDAAVGNYAILLPETYDFQEKLKILQDKDHQNQTSDSEVKSNSSLPSPKKLKKNISDEFIWKDKLEELKKNRLRKPYEQAHNKMKKRKRKQTSKSTVKPVIEEFVTHMISSISESITNNEKETISDAENIATENSTGIFSNTLTKLEPLAVHGNTEQQYKFIKNEDAPAKKDIYAAAFGPNAIKIKEIEVAKWFPEKKAVIQPYNMSKLSKKDTNKFQKEKIIFKGPL